MGLIKIKKGLNAARNAAIRADERIFAADDQLALLLRPLGDGGNLCAAAADEEDALLQQPVVELLVSLAEGPHVDIELEDLGVGLFFEEVGELKRVHAAHARAVAVVVLVAAADAVQDGDGLGRLAVAHDDLAVRGPGGVGEPLELERGDHVGESAVAVLLGDAWVEDLEAGGDDHGPGVDLDLLVLDFVVNRVGRAVLNTNTASLAGFRVDLIAEQATAFFCRTVSVQNVNIVFITKIADGGHNRISSSFAKSTQSRPL